MSLSNAADERIEKLGLDGQAARWLRKALHPVSGGKEAIPDAQAVPVVLTEYIAAHTFSRPAGLTQGDTWDLLVIKPPSNTIGLVGVSASAGADFYTTTSAETHVVHFEATEPVNCGYDSFATTLFPLAPEAQEVHTRSALSRPVGWRTAAASLTAYNTSSALVDGGTVYAGQYARKADDNGPVALYDENGLNWNLVVRVDRYDLPLDEEQMAIMAPKGLYTAPAREGTYVPIRLAGPTQDFVVPPNIECAVLETRGLDGERNGAGFAFETNRDNTVATSCFELSGTDEAAPWSRVGNATDGFYGSAAKGGASSGFDDHCNWGITLFRGLPYDATISAKSVSVIEVIPAHYSPFKQFVEPAAPYNPIAMQLYYDAVVQLAHAYPADHNSLGLLAGVIKKALATAAKAMLPLLGSAARGAAAGAVAHVRAAAPPPPPPPAARRARPQVKARR